ncbi:NHLP leader peptide family RiPP precursor [Pilimelia columellifera]|uniref:Nitrile hydratase alpha/Thiocyanate hydrolase gamma domain-containing protein n=1 Tax=Pilimelia columellifera subsp. columellifera TaxID=706583 RepID=A0ABP6AZ85_9ACTN
MPTNSALVERVVEKARSDASFRSQLIANPKAAIESELGITIPTDLNVKVVEEQQNEFYVVLPPKEQSGQLSDEQLAGVAGGDSSTWGPNCSSC